jgi:hypothetical protein
MHEALPMKPSRTSAAFTVPEFMVTLLVVSVVAIIGFTVLRTAMVLFAENVSLNVSGSQARLALDRIGDLIRYSKTSPDLIEADGSITSGSAAPGILVKRMIGGPYLLKEQNGGNGGMSGTETTFQIRYTTHPHNAPPVPQVGQTLIVVDLEPQVELEVVSVQTSNGAPSYRALKITTATGLGVDLHPSQRVTAYLLGKEAYMFAGPTSNGQLRHYPSVKSGMDWEDPANFTVVLSNFRVQNANFFHRQISGGQTMVNLDLEILASDYADYFAKRRSTNTIYAMPLRARFRSSE